MDDFSRYIIAWKLCTTMKAGDVTETLDLALQASGLNQVHVVHRPRLLSDNGPSYISADLDIAPESDNQLPRKCDEHDPPDARRLARGAPIISFGESARRLIFAPQPGDLDYDTTRKTVAGLGNALASGDRSAIVGARR